jgi:hypothetical protein
MPLLMGSSCDRPPAAEYKKIALSAIKSPVIFKGDAATAYRDPTAIYHDGVFRLFYTYILTRDDGKHYWTVAFSKSRDLINWTEPKIITPIDQNLNFASPGDIIRYGDDWILCLQTYPTPKGEKYGNQNCRVWIMRSRDLEDWGPAEMLMVKGPDVPPEKMGRLIDAYLIEDKDEPGKWWCLFDDDAVNMSWSYDLENWTYVQRIEGGENVCVLVDGGEYLMFHSPRNGLGMKRSRDMVKWHDYGELITLGQKDWPWAQGRLSAGFVLDLRDEPAVGKYIIFFHGSGPEDESVKFSTYVNLGIAWSDDLIDWNWPGKDPKAKAIDFSAIPSPVVLKGDEDRAFRDPAVLYHDGIFHLYYTYWLKDPDDGKRYSYTAESTSTDLIHWTDPKVLTPKDLKLNFSSPGNVIRFGYEWIMCYQTYPTPDGQKYGNRDCRVWITRSPDLEVWSEPEMLMVKGPDVPVDKMGRLIDAYLIEDKDKPGKWWCFFDDNAANMSFSQDLRTWTYFNRIPAGENPCVIIDGDEYLMFHSPGNGIGMKRSKDLKTWRDVGGPTPKNATGPITLGQKDWPWASQRLTAGFVLDLTEDPRVGKYLMFFHAEPPGGFKKLASIGLAWSEDLETWNWPAKNNRSQ